MLLALRKRSQSLLSKFISRYSKYTNIGVLVEVYQLGQIY